jgi:hypothetical protein
MNSSLRDLPFIADLESKLAGLEALLKIAEPFAQSGLLQLDNMAEHIATARTQRGQLQDLIALADKFHAQLSPRGWIISGSINIDVIRTVVATIEKDGLEAAEQVLIASYDNETIERSMRRLSSIPAFRVRWEILESALEDYKHSRLYACIPQLLMMLDGVVSDLNGNRGFFTEKEDLVADNSFVGHPEGLNTLKRLFGGNRNKTTTEPIYMPYRNGILHGRDLGYANSYVATKTWAALFAVGEWAKDVEKQQNKKVEEPTSFENTLASWAATQVARKQLDDFMAEWKPGEFSLNQEVDLTDENYKTQFTPNTPEYFLGEFLYLWKNAKYGPLVDKVWYPSYTKRTEMIGKIRKMYEGKLPLRVILRRLKDEAPAIIELYCDVTFSFMEKITTKEVRFRLIYQDQQSDPVCRIEPIGRWVAWAGLYDIGLYEEDGAD